MIKQIYLTQKLGEKKVKKKVAKWLNRRFIMEKEPKQAIHKILIIFIGKSQHSD